MVPLGQLALDRPQDRIETDPVVQLDPPVLGHLDQWVLYHRLDLRVPWETHPLVLVHSTCHQWGRLDLDHPRRPVQPDLAGLYCRFRLDPSHRYRRLGRCQRLGRCRRLGLDLRPVHRSVRLDPSHRFAHLLEGPWSRYNRWLGLCPQWDRRDRRDQLVRLAHQCQLDRFDPLARLDQWWLCRLVQ